jgi:hypothetical protein
MDLYKNIFSYDVELSIHPTDYSILMSMPTAINVGGRAYFKFFPFSIASKVLNKNYSHYCCCEENEDGKYRCSYSSRSDSCNFSHSSNWVLIAQFPFSRIPKLIKHSVTDETQLDLHQKLLQSIILFFNKCNVSDISVECNEFYDLCLTILSFSSQSKLLEMNLLTTLKSITREKFQSRKN